MTIRLSPDQDETPCAVPGGVERAMIRPRLWIAVGLLVHGGLHLVAFRPGPPMLAAGMLPGGVEVLIPSALPLVTAILLAAAAATLVVERWHRAGAALTAVAALFSLLSFGLAADGLLQTWPFWLPGLMVSGTAFGVAGYLSLRNIQRPPEGEGCAPCRH